MHVIYFAGFYDIIAIVAGVVQTILYADFFYLYITKVCNSLFRKSIISNRLFLLFLFVLFLLHSVCFVFYYTLSNSNFFQVIQGKTKIIV